jgi:ABC-type polysaccharide/polyol phosphate transport system ATPase subunit
MMDPSTAIEIKNLSKRYKLGIRDSRDFLRFLMMNSIKRYHWALKDICLSIPKGRTVGVVGPNGAGKSTLLKILSKITTPTNGSFEVSGKVASLLEAGVGFHPEYTGIENVILQGAYLGMNAQEVKNRVEEIISFAGVGDYAQTPIKRYSSGMTLRLATSTALHLDADILLLDEILSVADVSFREKYSKSLEEIGKEQKKTILFVSHNHDLLSQSCDCGILVWEGTAKFYENFSECLTAYNEKIEEVKSTVTNLPIRFKNQTIDYEIIDIECNDFEAFKPFSLDIKYNVIKAGGNLSFGLGMMNRGQKGFSLSIDPGSTGNTLSSEIGSFQMTVNYPYLPCHPGEYELYISLWNGSFLEEVSTHKLLINIKGNQLPGSGQKTGFQVCPSDFENHRL